MHEGVYGNELPGPLPSETRRHLPPRALLLMAWGTFLLLDFSITLAGRRIPLTPDAVAFVLLGAASWRMLNGRWRRRRAVAVAGVAAVLAVVAFVRDLVAAPSTRVESFHTAFFPTHLDLLTLPSIPAAAYLIWILLTAIAGSAVAPGAGGAWQPARLLRWFYAGHAVFLFGFIVLVAVDSTSTFFAFHSAWWIGPGAALFFGSLILTLLIVDCALRARRRARRADETQRTSAAAAQPGATPFDQGHPQIPGPRWPRP